MANQAVENIAKRIYHDWAKPSKEGLTWETLPEYRKAVYRQWVIECVLPEFEEAK